MRRSVQLSGAIVALSFALAACSGDDAGSDGDTAASGSDSLVIYTARDTSITDFVVGEFVAAHPEFEGNVEVLNMGGQEVLERVRAESANPQGDVWWGGTQQAFAAGSAEELLAEWEPAFAAEIDDSFKDPNSRWFGEVLYAQVILFNSNVLTAEEAPQDWDDLLDPQWEDQIIIRDVPASGGMRSIYSAMILQHSPDGSDPEPGFEWLRQLDANTADYAANPADMYLKLSREQGVVSAWNLEDIMIQSNNQDMPFGFVMPESGAPVLTDGVGVIEGGDVEAAQTFVEFLFEDELRAQLAADFFQLPTVELADEPEWLAEVDLRPMDVDWGIVAENEADWINHWNEEIKNKG